MTVLSRVFRYDMAGDEKIVITRSAHIGDFIVCIPLLEHFLKVEGLRPENVYFITINNTGTDPVTMLFGDEYFPKQNIHVVSNKPRMMASQVLHLRRLIGSAIDHVLYLPFYAESALSVLKKTIFLKSIFGVRKKIHGAYLKDYITSNSQYYSLLERFGYHSEGPFDHLQFLKIEEDDLPWNVRNVLSEGAGKKIAIYPHSKLAMKIWPRDNYVELIRRLITRYSSDIFLVGSQSDRDYNQLIADELPNRSLYNVAGELSVREMICFLSKMDLVIGNDGAPLHMAALAKAPIVGLYTYKAPVGMWDPILSEKSVTLRKNVYCKECYKLSCADPVCLNMITVDNVLSAISRLETSQEPETIILC